MQKGTGYLQSLEISKCYKIDLPVKAYLKIEVVTKNGLSEFPSLHFYFAEKCKILSVLLN